MVIWTANSPNSPDGGGAPFTEYRFLSFGAVIVARKRIELWIAEFVLVSFDVNDKPLPNDD